MINASARSEAITAIAAVLAGASLDQLLPEVDARLADPRDRALTRAIVRATLRQLPRCDALLTHLLDRGRGQPPALLRAILAAGLTQLDQQIGADHAVVSESVDAVKRLGAPQLAGVTNAVLRRFLRERDALLAALPDTEEVRYGHPRWLIKALAHDWPQDYGAILDANNAPAPLWLRVNVRRGSRDAYAAQLAQAGIETRTDPWCPDALQLTETIAPSSLPDFAHGAVSVQDRSAQAVVELMALAPGLRVLDACAAPGGKAAHMLERQPGLGRLVALDSSALRVARMQTNLTRLGLAADCVCADAGAPESWWDGVPFERILIDAPCSGSGVIRRHPDIRWLRRATDLAPLAATQDRLLDALWPLLAAGGRLVYVTCSVLRIENATRVQAFIARTQGATAVALSDPEFGRADGPGGQRFPGADQGDGFYYAVLVKHAAP